MLKVSVFAAFVCAARMLFLRTFCSLLLFVKNMFLSDCQKNQNTDSDSLSLSWPNICPSLTFCQKFSSLINTVCRLLFWLAWTRDSIGISKLQQKQLISLYKISCFRASLEIPILSLARTCCWPQWCDYLTFRLVINIINPWDVAGNW